MARPINLFHAKIFFISILLYLQNLLTVHKTLLRLLHPQNVFVSIPAVYTFPILLHPHNTNYLELGLTYYIGWGINHKNTQKADCENAHRG